jgi:uncharacterized membrane protein YjjP (DUF1212 family)
MKNYSLSEEQVFLIKFATIAYGYGVSLLRLESYLRGIATNFGCNLELMSNGNIVQFVFWDEIADQHSHFTRLPAVNPDLTKLILIENLANSIASGDISATEGITHLSEIEKKPTQYGTLLVAMAFGLIGAAVAVIFSTPWQDVFLGALLGLVTFGLICLAGKISWLARTIEFSAALVTAIIANVLAVLFPGSNPLVLVTCAVAIFIPGFMLTMGLSEVIFNYTVSGINRLVTGILITVKLFAGVVIGTALVGLFLTIPAPAAPVSIPSILFWLFMALLFAGIAIVFQVRPQDLVWVILVGILTFAGSIIGSQYGFWQGPFIGALILGICGNLFYQWRKIAPTIVILPGIMALVPGILAYLGLFNTVTSGLEAITSAAVQILVTVASLIIGLIVANTIVPVKQTL